MAPALKKTFDRKWSVININILLDLWREWPCLYDIKHAEYHNTDKRISALKSIAEGLQIIAPDIEEREVKWKLSILRIAYNNEKRKVEQSKRSGAPVEAVHKPKLKYYDYMDSVLRQCSAPARNVINSIQSDDTNDSSHGDDTQSIDDDANSSTAGMLDDDTSDEEMDDIIPQAKRVLKALKTEASDPSDPTDSSGPTAGKSSDTDNHMLPPKEPARAKKKGYKRIDSLEAKLGRALDAALEAPDSQAVSAAADEFDIFGKVVADGLRNIKNKKVMLLTQHKISSVLMEARIEDLDS
ncbi:hypothetical protein B566_EDAN014121 [Ephemera danica]|nr:hypothetical protein B566_EDAN014121 [Ephemera danica]